MKLIQTLKGYKEIKELIDGELVDFSYFEIGELKWNDAYGDYDEEDEEEHYEIEISGMRGKEKTLYFNYNKETGKIEIELSEDSWQEICSYDYKIKYFWMVLLEW